MIRIDMPMPTCCEDCFAQAEYYNPRFDETEYSCGINGKNLGTHSRHDWGEWHCDRPEWCPMKEQEAVVRCKDCKWNTGHCRGIYVQFVTCYKTGSPHKEDWYCADGLRKDGDGNEV